MQGRESEDDFSDVEERESQGNASTNATPEEEIRSSHSSGEEGEVEDKVERDHDLAGAIDKHVDATLDKYFKKHRSKKKKKKRVRQEYSSSSDTESDSLSSDSESDSESVSSDSSEEQRKSRKRKKKSHKKKERKAKKGKQLPIITPMESTSDSTVSTRGCKSPQNVVMTESDDESLDGGEVASDANTDEFIDSLNSSRNYSTPSAGRCDRSRSPNRREDREGDRRRSSPRDRERVQQN